MYCWFNLIGADNVHGSIEVVEHLTELKGGGKILMNGISRNTRVLPVFHNLALISEFCNHWR